MANYPTLSVNPSFPLDPDGELPNHQESIISSKSEAGYKQTRPRFTRFPRKWGVKYSLMSQADADTLRTFERDTVKGGADIFSWTHPVTSTVYSVRFAAQVSYKYILDGYFSVEFFLEEA